MITEGSKIKLIKPMGPFKNVGEVCEVVKIDTHDDVVSISFKYGNGKHLGIMSFNEFLTYFEECEETKKKEKRKWTNWEYDMFIYNDFKGHTYTQPVKYRNNGKTVELRTDRKNSENIQVKSSCNFKYNDKFDFDLGLEICDQRMQIKLLEEELNDFLDDLE